MENMSFEGLFEDELAGLKHKVKTAEEIKKFCTVAGESSIDHRQGHFQLGCHSLTSLVRIMASIKSRIQAQLLPFPDQPRSK